MTFWWPFGVLPTISHHFPWWSLWAGPFEALSIRVVEAKVLALADACHSCETYRRCGQRDISLYCRCHSCCYYLYIHIYILYIYTYITCTGTWGIPIQHYNCFVTIAAIASEWKCDEALANWNAHLSRVAWESSRRLPVISLHTTLVTHFVEIRATSILSESCYIIIQYII